MLLGALLEEYLLAKIHLPMFHRGIIKYKDAPHVDHPRHQPNSVRRDGYCVHFLGVLEMKPGLPNNSCQNLQTHLNRSNDFTGNFDRISITVSSDIDPSLFAIVSSAFKSFGLFIFFFIFLFLRLVNLPLYFSVKIISTQLMSQAE